MIYSYFPVLLITVYPNITFMNMLLIFCFLSVIVSQGVEVNKISSSHL